MSENDFRSDEARAEARQSAEADEAVQVRDPGTIDEDDMRAADDLKPSSKVAESYREATERGANARGEGRVP